MYPGEGLLYSGEGLPGPELVLPARMGEKELTGVLNLLEKDRELQELLTDVQVHQPLLN